MFFIKICEVLIDKFFRRIKQHITKSLFYNCFIFPFTIREAIKDK
jgi:hypothetical protein